MRHLKVRMYSISLIHMQFSPHYTKPTIMIPFQRDV